MEDSISNVERKIDVFRINIKKFIITDHVCSTREDNVSVILFGGGGKGGYALSRAYGGVGGGVGCTLSRSYLREERERALTKWPYSPPSSQVWSGAGERRWREVILQSEK